MYCLITLCFGLASMFVYRWIGGAYIGGKIAEDKWYNSRGVSVTVMILLFTGAFHYYMPFQPYWLSLVDSILFVSCYRLIGYDSYTDFGLNGEHDDEFTAPIMHRIFKKENWGTWIYDFTGILLRFGLVGLFFFIYKSLFVYFTIGYYIPQYKFLFLGFAPAFIYWAATTFEDKNPEVFDLFRTSRITDPLDSNRFIQKDKDLAEAIIGFLCGLLIA